jgi:hypothetical protein
MAVYVDDLNIRADVPGSGRVLRGRWSHLFADTEAELRAFAARIGLRPGWIQNPGQPHAHFDVTAQMRQRALAAGATPVTWRQAGEFFAHRTRQASDRGRALRQAAHLYLEHGLRPVPAWGATSEGACACPRGAACPRLGKHPRSVHVGPGPRDYSWKPLACHSHGQVDQRFADGGPYAAGNLMLAIPPGTLVIDQDDDDGGAQAIAALATWLGELPATLTHATPHGWHRIYATPPGWTGRAWVGKDPRNPLPPGIDLRVPGQILMAAPSQVPTADGLAAYHLPTGTTVAGLPSAYLTAWTPPQPRTAPPRQVTPVPSDRAGAAAAYVHAKITGIAAGLATLQPGGRNTAIYTAALKAGSTLGAASAERVAGGWDGQAAEDALMAAAETNGYIAAHGPAAARSAIRSGLRNGLRNPHPLPDFTATPARPAPPPHTAHTHHHQHGDTQTPARHTAPVREPAPDSPAADQRDPGEPAEHITTAPPGAAGHQATSPVPGGRTAAPPPQQQPATAVTAGQDRRATQAAAAADEAYRAGDFSRARQLISHAAALDPGRASLWAACHREIAAKHLFTQATTARQDGDRDRAAALLDQCRALDPRLEARWHRHLTGIRHGQLTRRPPGPTAERANGDGRGHPPRARQPAAGHAPGTTAEPQPPGTPARTPQPATTGPPADGQPHPARHVGRPAQAAPPGPTARNPRQPALSGGGRPQPRQPEHGTPEPAAPATAPPTPAGQPEPEQEACG